MKRDRLRTASPRGTPSSRAQARASGAQPAVCTAIRRGARRTQAGRRRRWRSLARARWPAPRRRPAQRACRSPRPRRRASRPFRRRGCARLRPRSHCPAPARRTELRPPQPRGARRGRRGRRPRPRRRSQTTTAAPRSPRRRTTPGAASVGMKTSSGQSAARAITAAASAALPQEAIARRRARKSSPRARPEISSTRRVSMTPIRCRALCDPETSPVSSLIHSVTAKPERRGERRLADERRAAEAAAVDAFERAVQIADEFDEGPVRKARGARQAPGREPAPVAQERIVLVAGGELGRIGRGDKHMVDVVAGASVGAGEREERGRRRRRRRSRGRRTAATLPSRRSRQRGGGAALRVEFARSSRPRRARDRGARPRRIASRAPRNPRATRPAARPR